MAFNDLKRYSDRLRIKNIGLFDMGDPKARRDRCWSPWCGNWVEDMKDDMRCHEPECDKRLWHEAVKAKMALFDPNTNTYMGAVDGLLIEPTFDVPIEYMPFEVHADPMMCRSCKKDIKRPNSEVCIICHMAGKSKEFSNKESKSRTRGQVKLSNRIKGLDKLRGKIGK